jgi:hypothetical protein
LDDEIMESLLPQNKDISVMHLNADWGYIAYIEKKYDSNGELIYEVVRVPLGEGYKRKRQKRRKKGPALG